MEEEETYGDDVINVKGLLALINDSPDGDLNMCDIDTSQVVQESSQNQEHTWFLYSGCSQNRIGLNSLLADFV